MLTKLYLTNKEIAVFPLSEIKGYNGFAILDCFGRIHRNHKNFLPILFNDRQVFISSNSFQQNHSNLSRRIRKYIDRLLPNKIIAIGGEAYLYGITKCEDIIHYTNSKYIFDDCEFNNKFYRKNIENNLIDYNKDNISNKYDFCLVNLSKLPTYLVSQLNKNIYCKLVIISCNHEDFWKKRELLDNYRLVQREKFICWKIGYFLTINIFVPKFISLGGNCSVAHQLQKRNLRSFSYPFDWSKIKYNKLVDVLKNNFVDFTNCRIGKYSENHDWSYIIKNKYCSFAHEVNDITELEDFQNKLERRIKRFNSLGNCVFIRVELDNVKDYSQLVGELDKLVKNYRLIVISKEKPTGRISHYKLPKFIDWKINNFDWEKII